MPKFNTKKGISKVKREAKKLPGRVARQIPNAAVATPAGRVAHGVARAVASKAGKKAVKKVAKRAASSATRKQRIQTENIWAARGMKVVGSRLKPRRGKVKVRRAK